MAGGGVLGKLMVVLGINPGSYKRDVRQFAQDCGLSAKQAQKEYDKLNFNKFRKSLWGIQGFLAGWGVERVLSASYKAWQENEQGVRQLDASLHALGAYTPQLSGYFKRLADELQRVIKPGDEAIMQNISDLLTLGGVQPEDMKRTLMAAADLGEVVGSMDTAVTMLAKAAAGSTVAFSKWGIKVKDDLPTYEKFLSILDQLNDRFGGRGLAAGNADPFNQLKKNWDEIKENIGGAVVELDKFYGISYALANMTNLNSQWQLILSLQEKLERSKKSTWGGKSSTATADIEADLMSAIHMYNMSKTPPTTKITRPSDPDAAAKYEKWFQGANKLETGGMSRIPLVRGPSAKQQAIGAGFMSPMDVAQGGMPTGDATSWQTKWDSALRSLTGQFGDFKNMFENMQIDIVTGWDNAFNRLFHRVSSFGDFTKSIFASIGDAFLGMASRIATEKLFQNTIGRISGGALSNMFGGGTGLAAAGGGISIGTLNIQGADARSMKAILERASKRRA